jgi:hypothetical protein
VSFRLVPQALGRHSFNQLEDGEFSQAHSQEYINGGRHSAYMRSLRILRTHSLHDRHQCAADKRPTARDAKAQNDEVEWKGDVAQALLPVRVLR